MQIVLQKEELEEFNSSQIWLDDNNLTLTWYSVQRSAVQVADHSQAVLETGTYLATYVTCLPTTVGTSTVGTVPVPTDTHVFYSKHPTYFPAHHTYVSITWLA